jgi:hypothetical protein
MRSPKKELIVPVRDRRQRRRILTLKNFRNAAIVAVILGAGIAIEEHFREAKPSDGYGRLLAPQIETAAAVPRQPAVPAAPNINDQDGADLSLLSAAARSQILMGEAEKPPQPPPSAPVLIDTTTVASTRPETQSQVSIVDGPNGVTIVRKSTDRPVLGGGFGRQQ